MMATMAAMIQPIQLSVSVARGSSNASLNHLYCRHPMVAMSSLKKEKIKPSSGSTGGIVLGLSRWVDVYWRYLSACRRRHSNPLSSKIDRSGFRERLTQNDIAIWRWWDGASESCRWLKGRSEKGKTWLFLCCFRSRYYMHHSRLDA